jgi:hypothetical protein
MGLLHASLELGRFNWVLLPDQYRTPNFGRWRCIAWRGLPAMSTEPPHPLLLLPFQEVLGKRRVRERKVES